jgi:hypothetical protein
MKLKQLVKLLDDNKEANLRVMLPSGEYVPDNFHITEVGRVYKKFIDCGGTVRSSTFCTLQVWTAHDVDHRLLAGKLSKILEIGNSVFGLEELDLEVEYGSEVISQYLVTDVMLTPKGLVFVLDNKKTDCLAPDKCGISCC